MKNNIIKKTDFCCYPYIHSKDWVTDFEVFTDGLSSEIGLAYAFQPFWAFQIKKDLQKICQLVLDLNPMVRKPNAKILTNALNEIKFIYEKYKVSFNTFYLPVGSKRATSLSRLRFKCKQIIRLLVWNKSDNEMLLKVFNLLTNLFHLMWLQTTSKKIRFNSKTYV